MKKRSLVFFVVIAVAIAFAYSCKKGKDKPTAQLTAIQKVAKRGTQAQVQFDHVAHKKYAKDIKKNCKFCHHKGRVTQKCSECHKDKKGAAALHKNCIDKCHVVAKKGPQKADCVKCHVK